jgi:hypothetical protein
VTVCHEDARSAISSSSGNDIPPARASVMRASRTSRSATNTNQAIATAEFNDTYFAPDQAAEAVSDGGNGVVGVVVAAGGIVAVHAVLALEMADNGSMAVRRRISRGALWPR